MRALVSLLAFVATILSSHRLALVAGLNVRDTSAKHKDVLVVVMGQLRGSEMAWESLRRHVLTPWAADLAVMTDVTDERNERSSLFRDAVYKWHEQEHGDWGEVFDQLPDIIPRWRASVFNVRGSVLGRCDVECSERHAVEMPQGLVWDPARLPLSDSAASP